LVCDQCEVHISKLLQFILEDCLKFNLMEKEYIIAAWQSVSNDTSIILYC